MPHRPRSAPGAALCGGGRLANRPTGNLASVHLCSPRAMPGSYPIRDFIGLGDGVPNGGGSNVTGSPSGDGAMAFAIPSHFHSCGVASWRRAPGRARAIRGWAVARWDRGPDGIGEGSLVGARMGEVERFAHGWRGPGGRVQVRIGPRGTPRSPQFPGCGGPDPHCGGGPNCGPQHNLYIPHRPLTCQGQNPPGLAKRQRP